MLAKVFDFASPASWLLHAAFLNRSFFNSLLITIWVEAVFHAHHVPKYSGLVADENINCQIVENSGISKQDMRKHYNSTKGDMQETRRILGR
ncbi:MAG: hypothetical protein Q7U91_07335 [Sideroxyarcus sp.]|nr:hypothetical protein [Sideroxyarcus sp.]